MFVRAHHNINYRSSNGVMSLVYQNLTSFLVCFWFRCAFSHLSRVILACIDIYLRHEGTEKRSWPGGGESSINSDASQFSSTSVLFLAACFSRAAPFPLALPPSLASPTVPDLVSKNTHLLSLFPLLFDSSSGVILSSPTTQQSSN